MQSVSVRTAQNISIAYPLASVGDRLLAYLIDIAIIFAWTFFWLYVFLLSDPNPSGDFAILFRVVFFSLPWLIYHLLCEILLNGQSLGKKQMKIQVVSLDGVRPSVGHYLTRWAMRMVDILVSTGAIAIVSIAGSEKGQRLGDVAANTAVVKVKEPEKISGKKLYQAVVEGYQVVYPQAGRLSGKDIATIDEALELHYKAKRLNSTLNTFEPILLADTKVRETLGINPEQKPLDFLPQIIKDYIAVVNGITP